MPFKSEKQRRWAWANHMPWAKSWQRKTGRKKLPNSKRSKRK